MSTHIKNGIFYAGGNPMFPVQDPKATVKANAATASIAAADFPKNNTNTGAIGATVMTLPSAFSVAGQCMRFYITAAQQVSLDPLAADAIYLAGSGVANKDLVIAGVIGNYVDLYSDGVYFYVTSYSGVVTKEA